MFLRMRDNAIKIYVVMLKTINQELRRPRRRDESSQRPPSNIPLATYLYKGQILKILSGNWEQHRKPK